MRSMSRFAENTTVTVERSRAEIERLIVRYGATSTAFMNAPGRALIMFECRNRRVVFDLSLPDINAEEFALDGRGKPRALTKRQEVWEQACRQRWRALALVIKAKLEAVESGITSFEDEFLSHIQTPDGRTVGDHVKPALQRMYESGEMRPLLPPPSRMQ
jgi:hypothetical protein